MQADSAQNRITAMRRRGIRFGTGRTRALLNALGSPDDRLKIIHVAGSNGKGSVCAYLSSVLMAAGRRVGVYTTPEVFCFEDQFSIDGKISRDLCEKYLAAADEAAERMGDKPTAYERQTAAAFLMFAGEGCEYAVIEACMGGLLDTTNAVNKKMLAAITSISLEHTEFLGSTLREIAENKAGIIKNCPAVISRCVPEEVRPVFYCRGARLSLAAEDIVSAEGGSYFTCGGRRYFTRMAGCMQPHNAALAITCAQLLGIGAEDTARGIAAAQLPGRLQIIKSCGKKYILDGAHNPESFIPLAGLLGENAGKTRTVVYGCLSDKNVDAVLKMLRGRVEKFIAVRAPSYRAMDFNKMFSACRAVFPECIAADSIPHALDMASGGIVAVCGSFTLLKEAKQWIEKEQ